MRTLLANGIRNGEISLWMDGDDFIITVDDRDENYHSETVYDNRWVAIGIFDLMVGDRF